MGFPFAATATKRSPLAFSGGRLAAAAVIVLGIAGAFWTGLPGPFLYDDVSSIPGNPTLASWSRVFHPPPDTTVGGRPILNLSFAANRRIGGTGPLGYHAVNVAIHALAALALFGIVRRTLKRLQASRPDSVAAAATLIWALHPLQTEAVTYIVQRAESLMGLCFLATVYLFIRGVEAGTTEVPSDRTDRASNPWFAGSIAACLLGMGVKEAMVTAPFMVLLYDRTFAAGTFRDAWRMRRWYYIGLAATWLFLAALVAGNAGRGGTAGFDSGVPWWAYALSQFRAVPRYLCLAFWPHPLVADYGRTLGGPPIEVALGAVAILVLAGATLIALRRRPAVGFLGAWFFVILAPTSSIIPVATEIAAEHRMYLPLAAIAVGFSIAAFAWLGQAAPVVCGVAALALAVETAARNRVYLGNGAFWGDVVAKMPDNAGARNNLGNVLFEEGRYSDAAAQYGAALLLAPDYADAHTNLGHALVHQGRLAEAVENYREALRFRPRDAAIHAALAAVYYRMGNQAADGGRTVEAGEDYELSLGQDPDNTDVRVNYGNVLAQSGRVDAAIGEYQAALRIQPAAADIHNNLGSLFAEHGRWTEARAEFETALRLKPDYPAAQANLDRLKGLESGGTKR